MNLKSPRNLLWVLFGLMVVVELTPILIFHRVNGIWALNNGEDFDFLFWPPLNSAFTPSFFFYHVGTISWGFMKVMHLVTRALTGSPVVTLTYLQTFGFTVRWTYAILMLSVPMVYYWRRRDPVVTAAVIGMGLALNLATPFIFRMYHLRAGTQLTNKLLLLITAALFFDSLRSFLNGVPFTRRRIFGCAVFSGILFLEIPSYILFFLPFVVLSNGDAQGVREVARRCGWWITGGLTGFLAGLIPFYGADWESATAAICSMLRGLVVGFPQFQPGFREHFMLQLFNYADSYFWIHVALATHIGVFLFLLATVAGGWRRLDHRTRFAALALAASFALTWLAHTRIWATRGSYTSVFSLTYYGFYSMLAIILLLQHANLHLLAAGGRRTMVRITAGLAMLAVGSLVGVTLFWSDLRRFAIAQSALSQSFVALNQVVESLPKPISLKLTGLPEAPFLVPGHYAMAGFIYHAGPGGWNGQDTRYHDEIQRERFPDYRILWPQWAEDFSYDYSHFALEGSIANGWPEFPPASVLSPLLKLRTKEQIEALAHAAHMTPLATLDAGQSPAEFLASDSQRGLTWAGPANFRWATWSIIPLNDSTIRRELLDAAWPEAWSRERHRFYFVTTYIGQYIFALPLAPGAAGSRE